MSVHGTVPLAVLELSLTGPASPLRPPQEGPHEAAAVTGAHLVLGSPSGHPTTHFSVLLLAGRYPARSNCGIFLIGFNIKCINKNCIQCYLIGEKNALFTV